MPSARYTLPVFLCSSLFLGAAHAATFESLYSFGNPPDGAVPSGAMAVDGKGVLFGATQLSGAYGGGTVFSLTPPASPGGPWQEAVLWSFGGPGDGHGPIGGVTMGSGGVLYGTTFQGGTVDLGTVFSLAPPESSGGQWTENVIWSFGAVRDGVLDAASPWGGLVFGSGGILYGEGLSGVFSLTPPGSPGGAWTETVLGFLNNGSGVGCEGYAPVAIAGDGTIYGTTDLGLACDGLGTVFSMTPSTGREWTVSLLYAFPPTYVDGATPQGGVIAGAGGVLYGTTIYGGSEGYGTIFSLSPPATEGAPWTEAMLYSFSGKDGSQPFTSLWLSKSTGALYGTTYEGGYLGLNPNPSGAGTVFALWPPKSPGDAWELQQLHRFLEPEGSYPEGILVEHKGVFYGTTTAGGAHHRGTVFSVVP